MKNNFFRLKIVKNKNNLNLNGVITFFWFSLFFKVLNLKDGKRELKSYFYLKKYYPVSKLLFYFNFFRWYVLIFNFENDIFFIDVLLNKKKNRIELDKLFKTYFKVFKKTLGYTETHNQDIFFKDRLYSRLRKFYKNFSFRGNIIFNNQELFLDFDEKKEKIESYFNKNRKKEWSIVSQLDPGGLNLILTPIFLDYYAAGKNPIMAEFAVFLWYVILLDTYLAIKYNYSSYSFLPYDARIFKDKVVFIKDKKKIYHKIPDFRKKIIIKYIDDILIPILGKRGFDGWFNDLKNYLAMRILIVFDITKMEEKDKIILSLKKFKQYNF